MTPEHTSTCQVCHRRLTDPHAIAMGIGPVCAARNSGKAAAPNNAKVHRGSELGSFYGDVVFGLDSKTGRAVSNIPHTLVLHSPEGFGWNHGGDRAAEFALNILLLFVTREEAERLHQDFKWKFIATMPRAGGVIKKATIQNWIRAEGETR